VATRDVTESLLGDVLLGCLILLVLTVDVFVDVVIDMPLPGDDDNCAVALVDG